MLVVLAEVLLRKGDAGTERDLGADDTVTAKEAVSLQHVSSVVVVVERKKGETHVGVKMCMDPPLPCDMPSTRPSSSARTPLRGPRGRAAKGWHRYAVMILSSGLMALCMPTETASCPIAKWQKPRMSF